MAAPAYRDFYFPLNVFMHILTMENEGAADLHYALFEPGDSFAAAQRRSTDLLFERLPPPPAHVLDVGSGLGTTLARLLEAGYDAEGITPDQEQVAAIRRRFDERLLVRCARFEELEGGAYDIILFQESSQYIEASALFEKARQLTARVLVLDEFAARPLDHQGALHDLPAFLDAAAHSGFRVTENLDVSSRAIPTIDYFLSRFARYRKLLMSDLGLTSQQVDDLVSSGERYRSFYDQGTYQYWFLQLTR